MAAWSSESGSTPVDSRGRTTFDGANFGQNIFDNVDDPERFGTPINIVTPPRAAQVGVRLPF